MRNLAFCLGIWAALCASAEAVLISTGDGQGNITSPTADDFGFKSVGIRGSGSAVYLGGGWVLTDAHVGAGLTWFNNVSYAAVPNSAVQLANPAGVGYTPYSDLMVFQVVGLPNVPAARISPSAPQVGWQVSMAGNGRDRTGSQAAWTDTWKPTAILPAANNGFIWTATNNVRWGTNVIDAVAILQGIYANSETTFTTSFSENGTAYEAQGTPGDSGGGVFHKDTSTGIWYLAGVMSTINSKPGQPWGTSVYSNMTYSADLSLYRDLIYQTIALPGDVSFDGIVNAIDVSLVARHWLQTGSGATVLSGDANRDGVVNAQDLALVATNWTDLLGGPLLSVPEPGTLLLALNAVAYGLATLSRRKRPAARSFRRRISRILPLDTLRPWCRNGSSSPVRNQRRYPRRSSSYGQSLLVSAPARRRTP